MIKTYIIVAVVSYFLGSIPFGYILVKLFLKQDIRATGSGNIGATNVARSGAKGLAIATLLLDVFKGWLAVWLSVWVLAFKWAPYSHGGLSGAHSWLSEGHLGTESFAALIAIIGHMFPVWLRFRGGKGVATGVGAFAALAPMSIGIVLILFLAVAAITKYVSLGSILAASAFPVIAHFINGYSGLPLVLMSVGSALIILKHHENIRRLLAGTEHKFGGKKTVPPPDVVEKQA